MFFVLFCVFWVWGVEQFCVFGVLVGLLVAGVFFVGFDTVWRYGALGWFSVLFFSSRFGVVGGWGFGVWWFCFLW